MSEELPFGSRGGVAIRHNFPLDGEYEVRIRLQRQLYDYVRGLQKRQRLEVRLDGERVAAFEVGGAPGDAAAADVRWRRARRHGLGAVRAARRRQPGLQAVRAGGAAGGWASRSSRRGPSATACCSRGRPARCSPSRSAGARRRRRPRRRSSRSASRVRSTPRGRARRPAAGGSSRAAGASAAEEIPCARRILASVARRAFRRPVTSGDLDTPAGVLRGRAAGRRLRDRDTARPGERPGRSGVPVPGRARAGRGVARVDSSGQRSRAGRAPLVLPLEHHPRRRAARRGRARPAARPGRSRPAGAAHAGR